MGSPRTTSPWPRRPTRSPRRAPLYRRLVRPILFRLDPERAHELSIAALARAPRVAGLLSPGLPDDPRLAVEALGQRFRSPVGLAAGFDKYARAIPAWPRLGFGFVEIGTVTARPQPGNPRPRVHRLPTDQALINRLGFNNAGAHATAERLAALDRRGLLRAVPLGVNLGRSKSARPDEAPADYASSLDALWPYADYVVVNVSSPNTPGLRDLQEGSALAGILDALVEVNQRRAREARVDTRPLLVKIAPDLGPAQVDAIVDLALGTGLSGLVVANTTVAREGLASPRRLAEQTGGLSGRPLRRRSTDLVRHVARRAGSRLTVIGVGGVFTAQDAWEKIRAGASLVQLYTGFVYGGPATPARIAEGLLQRLEATGARSLSEVVGADG